MSLEYERLVQLALASRCSVCYLVRVRLKALEEAMRDVGDSGDAVDIISTCKVAIDCPRCRNTGYLITGNGKVALVMLLALDDSDVVEVIGRPR